MLERKKLAYGDGKIEKPKIRKSLVFSATLIAMAACSTTTIPRRNPVVEETRRTQLIAPEMNSDRCFRELVPVTLEDGERISETECRGNREFILTDRALYIRMRGEESDRIGGAEIRLDSHYSRTDMRSLFARGVVQWEFTDRDCYFLTKDRRLTVMPNEDMGDTIPEYDLPFETANMPRNRMIFHSGFLFIAPLSGDALVMSFGDRTDSASIPLNSADARAGFFVRENRLFFGRRGNEEREIRIGGRVGDVTVFP